MPRRARGFGGTCGSILRTALKRASSSRARHRADVADLRLSVDGVHVEKAGIDVALPWTETGSSWHLGSYVRGRKTVDRVGVPSTPSGGIINAGLYARGEHANRMVPIFLALKAGRRRLPFTDPFKRGIGASYVVPLYARRNDTLISKDAWSIWNLCLLLAQRPELQLRLGERIRMENLLRDLKQRRLPVVRLIWEFEWNL